MTPELLIELLDQAGFTPQPYASAGRRCVSAAVLDRTLLALSDIVAIMDDCAEASMLLRKARTETMHGHTVIYWPGLAWPEKREAA